MSAEHPGQRIAFIGEEAEEMVPIRRSEIRDFAEEVVWVVQNPIDAASAWSYAWFGVGVTATFSLVALLAVEGGGIAAGVIAGHGAAIVVGFFLAGLLHWIDKKERADRLDRAERLSKRISAIDQRAPTHKPSQ